MADVCARLYLFKCKLFAPPRVRYVVSCAWCGFKRMRVLSFPSVTVAVLVAILVPLRAAPQDNQVSWSNMVWESFNVNGHTVDHAALMVEVELEGSSTPVLMQLDLGTYLTVMYRSSYARLRRDDRATENGVLMSGAIANRRFQDETFGFRPDAGEPDPSKKPIRLGTVGSSFFEHRILLLDFVKQRLAILGEGAALPPALERGVEYLPLTFQYGHVLVAATIDGREEPGVIFDTGSSMIPFFTGHKRWTELTHRRAGDPANSIVRLDSWGRQAVAIGAPIEGALCIGSACVSHPVIYCEGSGLPNLDLDKYSFVASGLIGNVIFDGRFTVIVDIPGGRFGLVGGSLGTP